MAVANFSEDSVEQRKLNEELKMRSMEIEP